MASKRNAWVSRIAIAVVVVAVCFWIARSLGREAVEKLCSKTGLATIERFFERHGDQGVLIARLLPFVSFDFVSYFAGLTSMSFRGFMIATGIISMLVYVNSQNVGFSIPAVATTVLNRAKAAIR